jgi:shikimate dehydrogenase
VKEPPRKLVLLGHPLAHSLSPRLQNAALRAAGIDLTYDVCDVPADGLGGALERLCLARAGGNVTIPHKESVARACAHVTGVAARVGAVNTFWTEQGALVGDNTDVAGFQALAATLLGNGTSDVRLALLGAGGGAAAVCAAASTWRGARVRVFNRHVERAVRLAARFPGCVVVADSPQDAVTDATVVVNATPVGLFDDALPVPVDALRRDAVVMDLAYHPNETAWVRAARQAGHLAADGLEMLLVQGACAFERWFGFSPNMAAMRAALAA